MNYNLSIFLKNNAKKDPKKIFCTEINGNSITYGEFDTLVNQSCRLLKKFIFDKNSIVSLCLENSIEFLVIYFSCIRSNIIVNPLPFSISTSELKKNIVFTKSKLIISKGNILDHLPRDIGEFLRIDNLDYLKQILNEYESSPIKCFKSQNNTAAIYYSSGTTGNPKCVEYSHKNIFLLVKSLSNEFGLSNKDIFLGVLPMGHTAIINYQLLPCIMLGATIIIAKNFNSIRPNIWTIINKFSITNFQVVPTIIFAMLSTPYNKEDISKNNTVKYLSCGSAPLSVSIQKRVQQYFSIPVCNLYGLSETGPSHFDNPLQDGWIPGSIGKPLSVNECVIIDNNFNRCPSGVIGQIGLKGGNVFQRYFRNHNATKKAFYNGYFLTGDLGYYDEDGRYFFSDRIKDLIIKAGVNILPGEIEEVLYTFPDIKSAAVLGKPDKLFGEDIVAFIEPKRNSILTKASIINHLREHLQPLKIPNDIRFVKNIPKGPSGKILKKNLAQII